METFTFKFKISPLFKVLTFVSKFFKLPVFIAKAVNGREMGRLYMDGELIEVYTIDVTNLDTEK